MLGLAAGLLLTSAFSGCGYYTEVAQHVKTKHFDQRADAPAQGDLALVLPSFVPADASDITVHVDTEKPDAKMYDWTSPSPSAALPDDCTKTTAAAATGPFDPKQWPQQALSAPGWDCGPRPVHIRVVQQHFYAW